METYRLSSKLAEKTSEYLIQTSNDVTSAQVTTTVFVDSIASDITCRNHAPEIEEHDLLALVKRTHEVKKEELEELLRLFHQVSDAGQLEPMLQLGIAFYYRGFLKEAEGLLRGVTLLEENNHKAISFLGRTKLLQGQVREAIELCAEAARLRPNFPDFHFHLGEALLANSQCDQAIEAYQQAIEGNLYYGDAHFSCGLAHLLDSLTRTDTGSLSRNIEMALEYLRKSSLLDDGYRTLKMETGLTDLIEGRYRKAFDLLHQLSIEKRYQSRAKSAAINLKPTLYPELLTVEVLQARIDYLRREVSENPSYLDLYKEMALCNLHLARLWWRQGAEWYRRAYEMSPGSSNTRLAMEEAESSYEDIAVTVRVITEKN